MLYAFGAREAIIKQGPALEELTDHLGGKTCTLITGTGIKGCTVISAEAT